jgi:hypothetical protein
MVRSKFVGLVGALLPFSEAKSNGGLRFGMSLIEMFALDMPRRCPRFGGARVGEDNPFSDLVGLVLMTAIELPSRRRPPTNSLPPLLWPCPIGRDGEGKSFLGEYGEAGGLSSEPGVGGIEAPGLNEKAGSATLPALLGLSAFPAAGPSACRWGSNADMGRRPVVRGCDGTDEAGESIRAGKTNGGFGGGNWAS